MAWNYERTESEFERVQEGTHRIRIRSVEKRTAQSGREMLSFQFNVSGTNALLFYNIVFLEDRPEITNRNLTQFFDSFADIPDGNFNFAEWIGKAGAAEVSYNEDGFANLKFIPKRRQANLPAWKDTGSNTPATNGMRGFSEVDNEGMPF